MMLKYLHIFFCFYLLSIIGVAQPLVTNNGLAIRVDAGLTATIKGAFTNKTHGASLGTLDNAGTITLTGDWTNNSANTVFSTNSGLVQLTGTATAQTIGGTNSTGFYNLTTNNTFGTSPQIILALNTTVKNTLTMTQGNINLAGFTTTLGTAAATPGSLSHGGTSASGWMYGGNFARYINSATIANGSVTGLFPMGNNVNDFRPFYVSCPATAPTTGGLMTLAHTTATTVSNVSFADGASTVVKRHDALWTSFTSGGLAGGTYNLRGEGTGYGTIGAVADLRLTLIGSVVGTAGVNAGTTANPQVNRTGLTLAQLSNNFYIASVNGTNTPLPIELLSFNALPNNDKVNVFWATATEIDNDYFEVERSSDGINFTVIETVKSKAINGYSYGHLEYSIVDGNPLAGTSYYRLKQIDFSTKYSHSKIVAINFDNESNVSFIIYPNPNEGIFSVNVSGAEHNQNVNVYIYDKLGKVIYDSVTDINSIQNKKLNFQLKNTLRAGAYSVLFVMEGVKYSCNLIVQ